MKITFSLDKQVCDLDGKPLDQGTTAGKLLASQLVLSSKGDVLKYWDWAQALHNGKEVTVDESDYEKLVAFVNEHATMTILAKQQILAPMRAAKESSRA